MHLLFLDHLNSVINQHHYLVLSHAAAGGASIGKDRYAQSPNVDSSCRRVPDRALKIAQKKLLIGEFLQQTVISKSWIGSLQLIHEGCQPPFLTKLR